ncbi:MAG TPA: molybdopterin cofactor-binding domain-containing protein, partial [Thermoanaerobaculia bacterium]|nr:molybdopterin cofactor-binding domain-containing protein [Thermoanaerobaculia bacterium]
AALPVPEKPALKSRKEFRIIGARQRRVDGADIVTGKAVYGLDVRVPGMRYAAVARAPQLGGKVASFDATEAKKVRGVLSVVEIPSGVAVVAENSWAALRGRDALAVKWAPSPHASFNSAAHMDALARAVDEPGVTIRKDGEGRAGFAKAKKVVEALYLYPFAAHAAVEPVNSTALVKDGTCTLWSPSQAPNAVQAAAARVLAIPETAVTVNVTLLGGGFGRRLGVDFDVEAIEIAKRMEGTPVHLLWSREDDMRHGYFQAASAHRLRAGLAEDGKIVAWEHRKGSTLHNARRTLTAEEKANPETLAAAAWGVNDSPYAIADGEMTYTLVDAPVSIGPWRAVYSPSSVFARECFLDEVARATGKDPIALRLELLGAGDETIAREVTVAGMLVERPRMRKVIELVAAKSGWGGTARAGVARGFAANDFHGTCIAYVVDVTLRPSGELPFTVERVVCAVDVGVAINPLGVEQQVESGILWSLSNMKSEITMKDGAIVQSGFSDFPVAMIGETPARIETHIAPSDDERPHGLGEPTVCPFAPAVANALSQLAGKRIRRLPVRAADLARS